ncbi:MAG: polysaccharide deacetylase family protein [Coriobacteriia bacterium]|nr:polysaccharide deacetylase family protein [Coriobacteriia bacterium]
MTSSDTRIVVPPREGISLLSAVAGVLLAAALVAVLWGLSGPVRVDVDGISRTVKPGTTIADLAAAHYTNGRAGSLFSIKGGIIGMSAGDPGTYERNGRPVDATQRVFEGDVITSHSGADRTERTISTTVSIDPTATIQGTGPILTVVRPGKPGVSVVRKGAISGQIVSNTVVTPAENIVLQASMPASGAKLVALTFDDGPWPVQTEKIVAILKAAGVRATFFELGQQVQHYPAISRAVIAAGDVIGNHSWNHPFLTKLKAPGVRHQIADGASAIKAATGETATLFRPPYGAINNTVWAQAKTEHESIVLWDVDTLDWSKPGVPKILNNLQREIGRASIVLMHDGGGDRSETIAALPLAIDWLKAQGYTFVTVSELEAAR